MLPIIARTIFRIQERLLGRPTFAVLRELEASQHWPVERIEKLRLVRLQELVASAYAHCSYWRELMDQRGFGPADIRSLGDLGRFDLLDKYELRLHSEEMVWPGQGKDVHRVRTSGSTNEPLPFYTSASREAGIIAARIRGHRWIGVNVGDKEAYFWGSPVELSSQDRLKRLRDALTNQLLANAMEITPALVARHVERWRRWRPRCLFGYPSSFLLMAQLAGQAGVDLQVLARSGARCICTTSELLTQPDRQILADAFGLPVYDSYGLREGGLIGHECPQFTMHTNDEQLILETIDPQTLEPTNGQGELVLTNLTSHVMPIIRYRTGDIVTLSKEPCPCGRSLGRVSISGGRIDDFVVTSQGKWVGGHAFNYICRPIPGILKYQVRQDRIGLIRILLVTDDSFPSDGQRQVIQAARARLGGGDDEIAIEQVADIAPLASGKYPSVISTVARDLRRRAARSAREANAPPEAK